MQTAQNSNQLYGSQAAYERAQPRGWNNHPGHRGTIKHNGWIITFWADEDEDDGFCWSLLRLESEDDAYMSLREVADYMLSNYAEIERKVRECFLQEVTHEG